MMFSYDDLLTRLQINNKPLAVMVGAPLSITHGDPSLGVPDVDGMIKLARARADTLGKLQTFKERVSGGIDVDRYGADDYQKAFGFLFGIGGPSLVQEVIAEGVRKARVSGAPPDFEDDGEPEHWHLPRGTQALGELAARHRKYLAGPILTTNFDPLISLAIERSGGKEAYTRQVLSREGSLGSRIDHQSSIRVVHLHGHWRGEGMLHLPKQLQQPREKLKSSLQDLLNNKVMLVAAYGGWDDVFTRALRSVMSNDDAKLDLIWTFYGDEAKVRHEHKALVDELEAHDRVVCYYGVDVHQLFHDMLAQASSAATSAAGSGTPPKSSPPSSSSPPSVVPDVDDIELVESLTQVLDASKELSRVMAGPLKQRGRELAVEILRPRNLYQVAHTFKLGMQYLANQSRSAALADRLKTVFQRAMVQVGEALTEQLEHDKGVYVLDVSSPVAVEPKMAAVSGRVEVRYWSTSSGRWPIYAIGSKGQHDEVIEVGMTHDEHVVRIAAELAEDIDAVGRAKGLGDEVPSPHDATALSALLTAIRSKLAANTSWRLEEHEQSNFFTIVNGTKDPRMRAFADELRQKLPELRVIYSVCKETDQGEVNFCRVLNDFYVAYDKTQEP